MKSFKKFSLSLFLILSLLISNFNSVYANDVEQPISVVNEDGTIKDDAILYKGYIDYSEGNISSRLSGATFGYFLSPVNGTTSGIYELIVSINSSEPVSGYQSTIKITNYSVLNPVEYSNEPYYELFAAGYTRYVPLGYVYINNNPSSVKLSISKEKVLIPEGWFSAVGTSVIVPLN